jgi:hypothetical protein
MLHNDTESETDYEISLLDIIAVLSENIKLLLTGPILAASAAFGIAALLPKAYESTAWLVTGNAGARQPGRLLAAINSHDTFKSFLETSEGVKWKAGFKDEEAIKIFRRILTASYTPRQDYVSVTMVAPTPAQAQSLCKAFLNSVFESLKPTGNLKEQVIEKINTEKLSLKELDDLSSKFTSELDVQEVSFAGIQRRETILLLQEKKNSVRNGLIQLEYELKGVGEEILLQKPTFSTTSVYPGKGQIALVSFAIAGLTCTGWVVLRALLNKDSSNREYARKSARDC